MSPKLATIPDRLLDPADQVGSGQTTVFCTQRFLGTKSRLALNSMYNTAYQMLRVGRVDEAIVLLRNVLDRRIQRDGNDDIQTLRAEFLLGIAFAESQRYGEAEHHLRHVIGIAARPAQSDQSSRYLNLNAMNRLAFVLSMQGRNEEALEVAKQEVAGFRDMAGRENPDTVAAMAQVANLFTHLGDGNAALPLYRKILDIRTRTLGPETTESREALRWLTNCLHHLGENEEARVLAQRLLDQSYRHCGAYADETKSAAELLAAIEKALGRERGQIGQLDRFWEVEPPTQGS